MPTVPRQTGRTVQIRPVATPFQERQRLNLPAGAFRDRTAEGLNRLGQGLSGQAARVLRIGAQQQAEDNAREASLLDSEFANRVRTIGFGDGQSDPGFYSTRGQTSVNAATDVKARLEQDRKRMISGIQNQRVRQMFERTSRVRADQELRKIDAHTLRERETANKTASDARKNEAIEDGVAYNDNKVLTRSGVIIAEENQRRADKEGWSPEEQQARLETDLTALYQTAIQAAIRAGDPERAAEILSSRGAVMDGVIRSQLQEQVETATISKQVDAAVESYINDGLNERQALKAARMEKDKKKKDALVTAVTKRYAEERRLEQQEANEFKTEMYAGIWEGQSVNSLIQQNPERAALLDSSDLRQMRAAELAFAKDEAFASVSDGETLTKLFRMQPGELARVDPLEFQHRLTSGEFSRLQTAIKGASATVSRTQDSNTGYARVNKVLNTVGPEWLNIGRAKQTEEQGRIENLLRNELNLMVAEAADEGNIPTEDELGRRLQEISVQVSTVDPDSGFFGVFKDDVQSVVGAIDKMTDEQRKEAEIDPKNLTPTMLAHGRALMAGLDINDPEKEMLQEFTIAAMLGQANRLPEPVRAALLGNFAARGKKNPTEKEVGDLARALFNQDWETVDRILPLPSGQTQ